MHVANVFDHEAQTRDGHVQAVDASYLKQLELDQHLAAWRDASSECMQQAA